MTIAAISSVSANVPPSSQDSTWQAFGQLVNSLQAGNLTAAQSAYAALTQGSGGNSNSPIAQAISQIGDALQSGDLGKAQQALASLQQQAHAAKGARHHHGGHHHHVSGGDKSQAATATHGTATDPTTSTNLVDVTA